MRGFLLFLACAAPVVLASPSFWWLVQSETGAAPGVIVEADGAERQTFIGPRSPWPDWPLLPEGGTLRPGAYYGPAPGHPAQGFGDVSLSNAVRDEIGPLQRALAREGWSVTAVRYRLAEPGAHWLTLCTITARRATSDGEATVQYGFQLEPAHRSLSVHWIEGPPMPSWPSMETLPAWSEPQAGC
jgi:hypothetical protein